MTEYQKLFMMYELGTLTLDSALATRKQDYPVYDASVGESKRGVPKKIIRNVLSELEQKYKEEQSPDEHIKHIKYTADELTKDIGQYLHKECFRIGVAQKLINLYLKYLWCAGFIAKPPHCPIDGVIRDVAIKKYKIPDFEYEWTSSNKIGEYEKSIKSLMEIAEKKNEKLAEWELREFNDRKV